MGCFIHSPCCQSEPVCKRLIKNRLNMYRGNAKRQRFADGRSFWYLFAFRVGVNDWFFSYYIAICYIKNQWILKWINLEMALLSAPKSFLTDQACVSLKARVHLYHKDRLFFLVFMHNKGLYVYNLALIYAFYSLLDLIHSHCQTVES